MLEFESMTSEQHAEHFEYSDLICAIGHLNGYKLYAAIWTYMCNHFSPLFSL